MNPRVYTIVEAAAAFGYRSPSTVRKRFLDTEAKRRQLGLAYGPRGETTLLADAVDALVAREKKARKLRGPWRLKNLGAKARRPDADGV